MNINGTLKETKLFWASVFFLFIPILFLQQPSFASVGETTLVSPSKHVKMFINPHTFFVDDLHPNVEEDNVIIYVVEGTTLQGFNEIANVKILKQTSSIDLKKKLLPRFDQLVISNKMTFQTCHHEAHQELQEISDKKTKHACFTSKQTQKALFWRELGLQKGAIYNSSSLSDFVNENTSTPSEKKPVFLRKGQSQYYSISLFTEAKALVDTFRRGPPIWQASL